MVSLVIIAGVITLVDHLKSTTHSASLTATAASTTTPTQSSNTPANTPAPNSTGAYKDGSYSAAASYYVPHGNENIKVTLTLSNGTVTDASIQNSENDPTSAQYQEGFASMYKRSVVGQKISNLQLGAVGGASETTQGFNDAVSQIASQAHA